MKSKNDPYMLLEVQLDLVHPKLNMAPTHKIKILQFDTALFGFVVGRLVGKTLTFGQAREVTRECKAKNIRCVYAEFSVTDSTTLEAAARFGFNISDVRVVLERDLYTQTDDKMYSIRGYSTDDQIKRGDVPYLEDISREISRVSRFAFDKAFPDGSAEKLYLRWMRNTLEKKRADTVIIARETKSGTPVGVITGKARGSYGEIELVGVSKRHTRKGIASLLLGRVCSSFKKKGLKTARVTTPGRNIAAIRLYQKSQFFVSNISLMSHLWVD